MSGSKDILKDVFKDGDKKWKTSGFDPQTSGVQTLNPTQTCHIKPPTPRRPTSPLIRKTKYKEVRWKGGEGGGATQRTFDNDYSDPIVKTHELSLRGLDQFIFSISWSPTSARSRSLQTTLRLRTYNRVQGTDLWFSDNSIVEAKLPVYQRIPFNSFSAICIFLYILFVLSDIRETLVAGTLRREKVFSDEFFPWPLKRCKCGNIQVWSNRFKGTKMWGILGFESSSFDAN